MDAVGVDGASEIDPVVDDEVDARLSVSSLSSWPSS